MSVRIRLKRAGSKKRPFYRVVVTDSRRARDSRSIEDLGYYNPLEDPVVVNVDRERVAYWEGKGAQCSDTVGTLLKNENTTHPTRRKTVDFVAPAPVVKDDKEKKEKKAKKAKASAAKAEAAAEAAPKAKSDAPAKAKDAPAEAKAEAAAEAAPKAESDAPAEAKADEAPAAEEAKADDAGEPKEEKAE